MNQTANIKPA